MSGIASGAWRCADCKGSGRIAYVHDGFQREKHCGACRGYGEGWAPTVIMLASVALCAAAYVWFCNGAPWPP